MLLGTSCCCWHWRSLGHSLLKYSRISLLVWVLSNISNTTPSGSTTFYTKTTIPTRKSWQDPVGNRTTQRPPDHRKETRTEVKWTCPPFIRTGQNHLARHSERGKKTKQTEKEVGRQHQGMDRPGVRQVPEGREEQRQ